MTTSKVDLLLPRDPTNVLHAVTKQYVDAGDLDAARSFDYPLDQYGMVASSVHPDSVGPSTTLGVSINTIELYRIYVPANKVITGATSYVFTAGATPGAVNDSGYCLYLDTGASQVAKTVNDYTLFTSIGWRSKAFPSPIAAQSVGRFVRLGMLHTCTTTPKFAFGGIFSSAFYNGHVLGSSHRRGVFATSTLTFPASFTPSTFGTLDNPMLLLGLY